MTFDFLLRGILGEQRVDKELETTKNLCEWLGYLPLGLELVGRYLQEDPDLLIANLLEELEQERLGQKAIAQSSEKLAETEITAKLGVQAAFNLTWERLDAKTKEVGELLSLFDPNAIAWKYVDSISDSLNWSKKDVRNGKKQLYQRHLIKRLEQEEANYQIHPLIHEFLGSKLQASTQTQELKQAFTSTFIEIAQKIPDVTTLEIINSVQNAIPHLTQVAKNHLDGLNHTNLFSVFLGLGRFYRGQGLYASVQPWFEQCVSEVKSRLGENNLDYGWSLNNLALLYSDQGKYAEAELLFIQALEITKLQLGVNHPQTADSLHNLAILYYSQGNYLQAERLYIQALEIRKLQLGENHPHTADSLNNLAILYSDQGKYPEAEPLYIQVLEVLERVLGSNHPNTKMYRRNLEKLRTKKREVPGQQQQKQTSKNDSWLRRLKKRFFG
ncbi:tetratricopeptide repeat protein [Mastigocoleus testarum]|uniref:Uncharacterized protein n=1 Tax=Mastigocoleus testarum BC008 TaxID=371196 RepID=A0A0V8A0F5_9CYAN|nr:tetratricopeptide repeat protein [Mastigocoleus testarum]KST70070.1 hypothetical protein BC008_06420 [Mastigocoleus testarum BC008]KST70101.1 hypothetical protein BC008_06590 [Mastigocoleus testarum BC008]